MAVLLTLLWGVFRSDAKMILRSCRIARSASAARAFYLGNSKFLIFHPVPLEVSVICNGRVTDTSYFHGFSSVEIPAFCKVRGRDFVLFGSGRFSSPNAHVKVSPVEFTLKNFSHVDFDTDFTDELNNFVTRVKKVVQIPTISPPPVPLHPWWTWTSVGGVAIALFLILALCFCLFLRFRRNVRTIQKLSQSSPPPHYHGATAPGPGLAP